MLDDAMVYTFRYISDIYLDRYFSVYQSADIVIPRTIQRSCWLIVSNTAMWLLACTLLLQYLLSLPHTSQLGMSARLCELPGSVLSPPSLQWEVIPGQLSVNMHPVSFDTHDNIQSVKNVLLCMSSC